MVRASADALSEEVEVEAEAEVLASLWVVQASFPLASVEAPLVHHLAVKMFLAPWVQALPSFQPMAHRQPRALPTPDPQLPCLLP